MNKCEICLEETCLENGKKPGNCNCDKCERIKECYRFLSPTVRITTKCTQKCIHCCFSCSSEENIMMTVDMAQKISKFFKANDIDVVNIMGGEFFCNPDWDKIIHILIEHITYGRLVSNGDWAGSKELSDKVINFLKRHKNLKISISKDRWHTNKYVDKAEELLINNNLQYNIAKEEETTSSSIVPVGRAWYFDGLYSMFACYCQNPQHKYSFLIDEEGEIYKCSLGAWNYDNITNFLNGGFAKYFKKFNKAFYSGFIPNCKVCYRVYKKNGEEIRGEKNDKKKNV